MSGRVKPLEWRISEVSGWNGDFHTVPTNYTVRCADENGWKWSGFGGHGYAPSPESAKEAAQADYERRILSAIEPDATPSPAAEADLEAIQGRVEAVMEKRPGAGYDLTMYALMDLSTLLAEVARLRAREAELVEGLVAVRERCLIAETDHIAVTPDPHIEEELFEKICALINGGSDG